MNRTIRSLIVGIGLAGALSTPALADRAFTRANEEGVDTARIERVENGATAAYQLPSCDGVDALIAGAQRAGFTADGSCANGNAFLTLYGAPRAAERYLVNTIENILPGAGENLTPADVEAQRVALNAAFGRFSVTTPGSTHPTTTIASVGTGVDGTTTLEQYGRDGIPTTQAYCKTEWLLTRLPTLGRSGTAYPQHTALIVNAAGSDMVDATSYCRMNLRVENGNDDLITNNYASGAQYDVQPAAWASTLEVMTSTAPTARDERINKNVPEALYSKSCDLVGTSSTCYDTEIAFLRGETPDTYREEMRTTTGVGGLAILSLSPTYQTNTLYRGYNRIELTDPLWTYTKELANGFHAPKEPGMPWLLGDSTGVVANTTVDPILQSSVKWAEEVYVPPAHASHLEP